MWYDKASRPVEFLELVMIYGHNAIECIRFIQPADEISFQNIKLQTLNPKSWTLKPTSDMTPQVSLESKISSKLW